MCVELADVEARPAFTEENIPTSQLEVFHEAGDERPKVRCQGSSTAMRGARSVPLTTRFRPPSFLLSAAASAAAAYEKSPSFSRIPCASFPKTTMTSSNSDQSRTFQDFPKQRLLVTHPPERAFSANRTDSRRRRREAHRRRTPPVRSVFALEARAARSAVVEAGGLAVRADGSHDLKAPVRRRKLKDALARARPSRLSRRTSFSSAGAGSAARGRG